MSRVPDDTTIPSSKHRVAAKRNKTDQDGTRNFRRSATSFPPNISQPFKITTWKTRNKNSEEFEHLNLLRIRTAKKARDMSTFAAHNISGGHKDLIHDVAFDWYGDRMGRFLTVPGLFSVGYFPIVNFLKDISLSDKCQPRYLPIMELYPSCFAHQEKLPPGLIPITILPIYWRSSTHQIFTHHQIIAHQRKYNLVYY